MPILRQDVNQRQLCVDNTPNYISYIGFSIACCLNLLHTKNTAKGANLLHPLDVQKAKKRQLQGASPADPSPGALPSDSRWGLRPQTPVIGSRYRARHGPHFFAPSGAYAY